MFVCALAILTLLHGTLTVELVPSREASGNRNNCSSTADPSESTELTEQFISNLTITDVRSILEILMVTFKKQPNLSTLKLLQMLINNLVKQNVPTEQLHRNFLDQLGHYEGLTNLLGNLSLHNTSEELADVTDSSTTPFPFTKIQLLSLFTPYNTAASTEKSNTDANLSTVTTETFSTFTTQTIVSRIQEETETTTVLSTIQNNNIYNQTELIPRSLISKRSKNSKHEEDASEVVDLQQEIDPVRQERFNIKSNLESSYQAEHVFKDNSTLNISRNASEVGILQVQGTDQTLKSSSATTDSKVFPQLTEFLLKTLDKLKIKYVRTYSESFEPVIADQTSNRLVKDSDRLSEFNRNRENMYINEPMFRSSRRSRSVRNFKENPNYLNADNKQHSSHLNDKELSSDWYQVFGNSLFEAETEDYSKVLSMRISKPAHINVGEMDVHNAEPVSEYTLFNKDYLITKKGQIKEPNKYAQIKQAGVGIPNGLVDESNADLNFEDSALINAKRGIFGAKQNFIKTKPTLGSHTEDTCSATKKSQFSDIRSSKDGIKLSVPLLTQTVKSTLGSSWIKKHFVTTDTSQEMTTRKPLRPPGTLLSRRIQFFLKSL